jgi:hypothetical protein
MLTLYSILILASAVFYSGEGKDSDGDPASLFDAHDLIRDLVGSGMFSLLHFSICAVPDHLSQRCGNPVRCW